LSIRQRSGKKLARTPLLARLRNDAVRFARWKHRVPTLATPTRFPKYLAKQTSSGIGQTAAFDPERTLGAQLVIG
jgi:hypothetical protein